MAFDRVLVALDGSARDGTALSTALRAAKRSASLRLVHVRGWLPLPPPSKDDPGAVPIDANLFTESRAEATDLVEAALYDLRAWGAVADRRVAGGTVVDGTVVDGTVADGRVAGGTVADGWVAGGMTAEGMVIEVPRSMVGAAIVTAAEEWDADLIVLCRQPRRTVTVWLRGSVSEQVRREAPCPVLLVRP